MPAICCVPTMCQPLAGYLIHILLFNIHNPHRHMYLHFRKKTLSLRKVQECLQNKRFLCYFDFSSTVLKAGHLVEFPFVACFRVSLYSMLWSLLWSSYGAFESHLQFFLAINIGSIVISYCNYLVAEVSSLYLNFYEIYLDTRDIYFNTDCSTSQKRGNPIISQVRIHTQPGALFLGSFNPHDTDINYVLS